MTLQDLLLLVVVSRPTAVRWDTRMTLPAKGSRTIEHEGRQYRWHVRRKPTYGQAALGAQMTVGIELCAENSPSILHVRLSIDRPDNCIAPHQTALKPAHVKSMIAEALAAGWNATAPGPAFEWKYSLIKHVP